MAWRYWPGNLVATLVAAIAAAALLFGVDALQVMTAPHAVAHAVAPAIDARLPEASWSAFTQKSSTGSLAAWLVRIPTWAGLALLLVCALLAAGAPRLRASHAIALALATFGTLLPIAAQTYGDRHGGWLMVDFRAYYCAAQAQRQGFSPYYVQPLHDCERSTAAPYYRRAAEGHGSRAVSAVRARVLLSADAVFVRDRRDDLVDAARGGDSGRGLRAGARRAAADGSSRGPRWRSRSASRRLRQAT